MIHSFAGSYVETNIIYLDKLYFLFIYKPEKDGIIEYIRKLSKYTIYRGRRMGRLVEFQNVKKHIIWAKFQLMQ